MKKEKCTCGEPRLSDGVGHRYDGSPCYMKEVPNPTPIEAILFAFDEKFVVHNSEGRKVIGQYKPWYNGHTESWVEENEVDDIHAFFTTEITALLGEIERDLEENKKLLVDYPNLPNKGQLVDLVVHGPSIGQWQNTESNKISFNHGLNTALTIIRKYKI